MVNVFMLSFRVLIISISLLLLRRMVCFVWRLRRIFFMMFVLGKGSMFRVDFVLSSVFILILFLLSLVCFVFVYLMTAWVRRSRRSRRRETARLHRQRLVSAGRAGDDREW